MSRGGGNDDGKESQHADSCRCPHSIGRQSSPLLTHGRNLARNVSVLVTARVGGDEASAEADARCGEHRDIDTGPGYLQGEQARAVGFGLDAA